MGIPASLRLGMIVGLIVALATAGVGLASAGSDPASGDVTTCQPTVSAAEAEGSTEPDEQEEADEVDQPEEAEGSDEVGEAEENDEGNGSTECDDEAPADEPSDETTSDGAPENAPADEASPERIAACTGAAGLAPADAPTEAPKAGELHGLDNAIAHVVWNCVRNDNDGLPNALSRLKANLDRRLLHDELKAQRGIEREAAKAARRAAHAAAAAAAARGSTHGS